ncbi:MAG: hypothetical protein ABEJ99_00270 [Candidatus Nanohaloarchaea archaeon]
MALSEGYIESFTGFDLSDELEDLVEGEYLDRVDGEEVNPERPDEKFYRLNRKDTHVQADTYFSWKRIEEYDGSVFKFLENYSEKDKRMFQKQGVRFYQEP